MKVGVTRKLPGCESALLSRAFRDVDYWNESRAMARADLLKMAAETEVLVCTLNEKIDEELLTAATRLQCLITFSVGMDHIDVPAVLKRNLKLVHTPDVLTDATADLTWALILGCARRLKPALRFLEEGKFQNFDPNLLLGLELRGRVLGIVGYGKIGRAVGLRAGGFGMTELHCGRPGKSEMPLEEVLKKSDVVSLHCPSNAETHHLISRRELQWMKSHAILVNTARGPLVDEVAATAHLRSHPDFYLGLDVFEFEPKVPDVFKQLPNTFCLPHIGSATRTSREAMGRVCMEEAIRFAKGEALQYEYRHS